MGADAQDRAEVVRIFHVLEQDEHGAVVFVQVVEPRKDVVETGLARLFRKKEHAVVVDRFGDLVEVVVGFDVVGELALGAEAQHVFEARQHLVGDVDAADVVGARHEQRAAGVFAADLLLIVVADKTGIAGPIVVVGGASARAVTVVDGAAFVAGIAARTGRKRRRVIATGSRGTGGRRGGEAGGHKENLCVPTRTVNDARACHRRSS